VTRTPPTAPRAAQAPNPTVRGGRAGAGRWRRRVRATPVLLAAGALALVGGGCGVSLKSSNHGGTSTLAADSVTALGHLPPRPQGEVEVDGRTQGSLTAAAAAAYEGAGARIVVYNHGEAQGFAELCRGQTDLVASQQPITPVELSVCQAEGVQPVQLEIAANGVVLATGGEVDVGADCLTVAQVKQIFQAGSEIENWSQLGYYDIPLRVVGPQEGRSTFDVFGETALGAEAPTLAGLRGDYQAEPSEGAVRDAVTDGSTGGSGPALHSSALASLAALHRAIGEAPGFIHEASFQVEKGVRDKRSAAAQAHDRANLAHAEANLVTLRDDLPGAERYVNQTGAAAARFQHELGAVGYFSLAYYENHEEQLRAFEIDSGALRPQLNCIFPSPQTVASGSYPLTHRLLVTVSLQDMHRPEVEDFLRFYLGQSQALASGAGMVPLTSEMLGTEVSWVDGHRQPQIVSYAAPAAPVGEGGTQQVATTTTNPASTTTPSVLAPAGGAGDEVSAADTPAGATRSSTTPSSGESSSGEGEATPSGSSSSQSSQPLTAGQ
jgi:ABC-type phosphate transport system substrate-binding protein